MTNKYRPNKSLFADPSRCLGCKTCELRCAVERGSISKNLYEAVYEEVIPRPRVYVKRIAFFQE